MLCSLSECPVRSDCYIAVSSPESKLLQQLVALCSHCLGAHCCCLQGILGDLETDLRRMMLPNTAAALRESKRNTLKDFVSVAGPLGVSHFLMLTATERSTYLKVAKTPRVGP
eukprot:GHRR01033660.1.p1 GENE.GHRR01033660.1~~GHRR01033660.1.p1  ORF type:complete len:113 (-),score=20.55 GHRR01033660.1:321-659(-)